LSEIGTPEDGQAFSTNEIRVLAPLGMLGYGYPLASFQAGLAREPHLIAVDAGSTDAGPHKLGRGVGIVSRAATKHDLTPMVHASAERRIPLVIGSAGGTGQRSRVDWTVEIVREISAEAGLSIRIAVIYADVTAERVKKVFDDGHLTALRGVPELSHDDIQAVTAIVAQMGPEPVMAALEGGADVIICGRAYDPAIFAALPMLRGFDAGLALHMGKILECGAQCATPGAASDCMLGILEHHGFVLEPLNPVRACTPITVSAHTLYEKSDPANLPGPGGVLDLSHCRYEALDERRVTVSGSRFVTDAVYRVKLEGAVCDGYRTVCMAGVRDPIMIAQLDECLDYARGIVRERSGADGQVNFLVYGRDAVMGKAEPKRDSPAHEVGLVIETIAADQETADHLCGLARATLMHFHYTGRMATAGNLAFAFAPSDMPAGPVYRFVLYHTMPLETGLDLFPVHWIEADNAQTIA
jgi:hypothetical protein